MQKKYCYEKKRGGGEIKVVGKVSAKLSSLIERLQQNTVSSENKVTIYEEMICELKMVKFLLFGKSKRIKSYK